MTRSMLRAKIHRVKITEACLDYDGSLGIAQELMDAADILPGEEVLVANLACGERFTTYAIPEGEGRGVVLNGAAAHLGRVGDLVIVMCFCQVDEDRAKNTVPHVVLMQEDGLHIKET